jgi:hypothetical protein
VSVDISGWSLQYGSATGTSELGSCVNCLTVLPQGSCIGPNGYFLIQLACGTNTAAADLPVTPDYAVTPCATAANNLSATSGKIALKADNVVTFCAPQTAFVDLVGYGTSNCAEGLAAAGLSNTTFAVRNGGGTVDTDNNNIDFSTSGSPVIHNSHTPGLPPPDCNPTAAETKTWGATKAIYR